MDPLEVSAVVLAQNHNPTILHPSFLAAEGIVPATWELAAPPLSMPPLATIAYTNGISFAADETRFLVRDIRPVGGRERFRACRLAQAYIDRLPHVPYTAVGINFQAFVEGPAAIDEAFELIFRRDGFLHGLPAPNAFNFSIQHMLNDVVRNLTITPAGQEFGRDGFVFAVNYHAVVGVDNRLTSTREALDAAEQWWQDFAQLEHLGQQLELAE